MYGAPPVCLNQSPGHPVQCAAMASQPAQSEGQGRGAPGSVSASHVLAATPFPKPWCLNVLLCGGGGSFLQMATVQCLLCGYGGLGAQALQVTPTINLAHTGKHGNGRKRLTQGSCQNSPGWGNKVGGSLLKTLHGPELPRQVSWPQTSGSQVLWSGSQTEIKSQATPRLPESETSGSGGQQIVPYTALQGDY